MLAKIKGNELLKYPYTFEDLQLDNPYTRFPEDDSLVSLFSKTESAVIHNEELVDVVVVDVDFDWNTEIVSGFSSPQIDGDRWVIKPIIRKLTQEELSKIKPASSSSSS